MTDHLSQSMRLRDGRNLMYAEYGVPDGKPVFYFHGLSGSRLEPGLLDGDVLVEAGIHLITPDRPGMGGSDFQPGRAFSHWPADIVMLADSLGLGKFGVLGVSGGGGYVSACARLIPERLSAAVIVSGAGPVNTPEARAAFSPLGRLMWWIAAHSARSMGLFLNLTKPRGLVDAAKVRMRMLPRMQPVERAVFDQPGRLEAFMASGMESMCQGVKGIAWDTHLYARPWDFSLEEICFPVRLLHGEADQNVPVTIARHVAATIPGCRATFYPCEGHISTVVNHFDEVILTLSGG